MMDVDEGYQQKQNEKIESIPIAGDDLNQLKEQTKLRNIPLIEEYDFKKDTQTADMKIELRPNTMIRAYQEQALSKMFSNGRARSGIIVLPCGAGKTLVGITAACTIKKSTLVVCTSQVSCEQWKREFLRWSLVNPQDILIFSSKTVNRASEAKHYKFLWNDDQEAWNQKHIVLICTYSMLSYSRVRNEETAGYKMMEFITKKDWGLMLLDEV